MEKALTWYRVFFKQALLRPGTYLKIMGMLLLVYLLSHIYLPSVENVEIGLYLGESKQAQKIYSLLEKQTDLFQFIQIEEKETVKAKVESGELECGFVFAEDFDDRVKEGEMTDSIIYYASPATTKGAVVMENVYAAFLENYSAHILTDAEEKLYEEHKNERMEHVMERFENYLDSDQVFDMLLLTMDAKSVSGTKEKETYPVQGIIGFFICFWAYLFYLKRWDEGTSLPKALNRREKMVFWQIGSAASITFPAVIGLFVVVGLPQSRGFLSELLHMIILFVYTVLWSYVIRMLYRSYLSYLGSIPIFVVVNVLICPIFFDIVSYVPAIKFVRLLFPLGIYLY